MPRGSDARIHAGTPGYKIGLVKKSWKHYEALSSQDERTDYIDELSWMVDEMMEKNDKDVYKKNKYVEKSASESDGEQSDKEEMLEELKELQEGNGQSSDKAVCGKLGDLSIYTKMQATTSTPEKSCDEVAVKRKRELQPLASFRPFIFGKPNGEQRLDFGGQPQKSPEMMLSPFIFGVPNDEQPMQWKTVQRASKQSEKAQVTFAEPN